MQSGDKRFICSFVKKQKDGTLKPNVVVIIAQNNIIARAKLCETYQVVNRMIDESRQRDNDEEGIKSIRTAETNTYTNGQGNDYLDESDDS